MHTWPCRHGFSSPGAGHLGWRPWASLRVPVLGALLLSSGPCEPHRAARAGPPSEDSAISMKTTAQGLSKAPALAAPPSASCAGCLDNWMECFAGRVLPGSLSSDFKKEGREDAGSRERGRGSRSQTWAWRSPSQDCPLSPSMVGSWSQAEAPGARTGQRVEAAKHCQIFGGANLVKSGPRDILGSRRGWTRTALWEC